MPARCPRCSRPLSAADLTGVPVDVCDQCGGTWLDRGELESVLARAPANGAEGAEGAEGRPFEEPAVRYLACPRCGDLMTRRQYERFSGVVLDYCNAHGVWADRGEIDRARAFREGGGVERRAEREAEDEELARRLERFGRDTSARAAVGSHWIDVAFTLF